MIGVGVQVVIVVLGAAGVLVVIGFLGGSSFQWNRTGGLEETRLTAEGLQAYVDALEAQNATLIERNTALTDAAARTRRLRHDGTARR